MAPSRVQVRIPASTTNLGPGFDVIGVALQLYNTVEVELATSGLQIFIAGEGSNVLSQDCDNLVYQAISLLYRRIRKSLPPMSIRLQNEIPLARGLGSSGTAVIGGVMAANALSNASLTRDQILQMAAQMDGHPDNVSASLLGGIVVASPTEDGIACLKFLPPEPIDIVIVVPNFELLTSEARAVLPDKIDLQTAVFNIGRASLLIASLATGDFTLLGTAMEDMIHQPQRKHLIPGMEDAFAAAKAVDKGAAVALSGAGPSLVALCAHETSNRVGNAMQDAFLKHNIESSSMVLDIDRDGAVICCIEGTHAVANGKLWQ